MEAPLLFVTIWKNKKHAMGKASRISVSVSAQYTIHRMSNTKKWNESAAGN
jgi:hypothetical protein